jgi:hypothetical protein
MTPEERPPDDERFVDEEADEAAAEAARIGGRRPEDDVDESDRPLEEAGEGEAEGFEDAERELAEHATHGDPAPDPSVVAGEEDEQAEEATIEYADADHFESSEREDLDEQ